MKALRCLGCNIYSIVMDNAEGYCRKCNIQLQEDKYLNRRLKLEKDEQVKRTYIRGKKKIKKKLKRKTKKKK